MQDAPCCAVDCIGTGFRVRMQEEEEGMTVRSARGI